MFIHSFKKFRVILDILDIGEKWVVFFLNPFFNLAILQLPVNLIRI